MPDKRTHRGPHPDDGRLFSDVAQPVLAAAVADMAWLLGRGYADTAGLKLVGDRFNLTQRQRLAVMRCACSDAQRENRTRRRVDLENLAGAPLLLDGYNVLITVEAALGGGVLFIARDGCIRDLASIHGTYRKVAETLPAIETIAKVLKSLRTGRVTILLDRPVSNSARLKTLILSYAEDHGLNWTVDLVQNPDKTLIQSDSIVATSDSVILDKCSQWLNLTRYIIETITGEYPLHLLDLSGNAGVSPAL